MTQNKRFFILIGTISVIAGFVIHFSSQEEVFDTVLEALDSLAAIVPDFPTSGVLGISGGSMQTITTIARYDRPHPNKPISLDETNDALHQVVDGLDTGEKKIFFSTQLSALRSFFLKSSISSKCFLSTNIFAKCLPPAR